MCTIQKGICYQKTVYICLLWKKMHLNINILHHTAANIICQHSVWSNEQGLWEEVERRSNSQSFIWSAELASISWTDIHYYNLSIYLSNVRNMMLILDTALPLC